MTVIAKNTFPTVQDRYPCFNQTFHKFYRLLQINHFNSFSRAGIATPCTSNTRNLSYLLSGFYTPLQYHTPEFHVSNPVTGKQYPFKVCVSTFQEYKD
jgi:hypothetical protein